MISIWFKRKGVTQVGKTRIKNYKEYINHPESMPRFKEEVINVGIKSLEAKGVLDVLDADEAYAKLKELAAKKEEEKKEKEIKKIDSDIKNLEKKAKELSGEEVDEEEKVTLEAVQNELNYKELQTIAKEHSMSGYTTKDKAGLQELIIEELELEG